MDNTSVFWPWRLSDSVLYREEKHKQWTTQGQENYVELKIISQANETQGVYQHCGCCNKLLKAWWLKTTEVHSFSHSSGGRTSKTSLSRIRSLSQNQGVSRAVLPPAAQGQDSFLASSSLSQLLLFLGLWSHRSHLCLHSHVAVFPSAYVKSLSYRDICDCSERPPG